MSLDLAQRWKNAVRAFIGTPSTGLVPVSKAKKGKKVHLCPHCYKPAKARAALCADCHDRAIALGTLLATEINLLSEVEKARRNTDIAEKVAHEQQPLRHALPITDVRLYGRQGPVNFHLVFYGLPAARVVRGVRPGSTDDEVYRALARRGVERQFYATRSMVWERTRVDGEDARQTLKPRLSDRWQ